MRCSSPGVPGHDPRASKGLVRRAGTGRSPSGRCGTRPGSSGRSRAARDQPRLGAVGQIAVGQQDDRRHVLDGDAHRLEGRTEAVGGRHRRDDRNRRLAVAPEHGLQQVRLLGLGRQPGRRPAALDVDDDHRQLDHHREPDGLRLEAMPGPLVVVMPIDATEGRAERRCRRRRSRPPPGTWSRRSACSVESSCRMSLAGVIG